MERRRRLSDEKRISAVSKEGRRWYNAQLGLRALPNQEGPTRYAFRVGKHIGKAVERNRVKRLIKEAARSVTAREGWDLLLTARVGARTSDFRQITSALKDVLARARLLDNPAAITEPKENIEQ